MPGGDRTGPNGEGPMTGRGAGYCAGNNMGGYMPRRSLGRGRGRGLGQYNPRGELRRRYQQDQAPQDSTSERILGLLETIVNAVTKK